MDKKAIAVVGNFKYLYKNLSYFYERLTVDGKYSGEVIILTSFLCPTYLLRTINKNENIKVLRFKKIKFPKKVEKEYLSLNTGGQPNRFKTKKFQWFKLNIFHKDLKKWRFILYLDLNITTHHDINKLFDIKPYGIMYAKADSYPNYDNSLKSQFDNTHPLFPKLQSLYNLDDQHYFQTCLIYFDTSIVTNKTLNEMVELAKAYPLSVTNEQGLMNLFFQGEDYIYKELPQQENGDDIFFYWMVEGKKILFTKQTVEQYK